MMLLPPELKLNGPSHQDEVIECHIEERDAILCAANYIYFTDIFFFFFKIENDFHRGEIGMMFPCLYEGA